MAEPGPLRRRLAALALAVLALHLAGLAGLGWLTDQRDAARAAPAPIEVAFVRALAQATPAAPPRPAEVAAVPVAAPAAATPRPLAVDPVRPDAAAPAAAAAASAASAPATPATPVAAKPAVSRDPARTAADLSAVPAPRWADPAQPRPPEPAALAPSAQATQTRTDPAELDPLLSWAPRLAAAAPATGAASSATASAVTNGSGASAVHPGPATATATATATPTATGADRGASAGAAPGSGFVWPPSTQLNYTLLGDYRGPVHGSARVEWVRQGRRYQVRMDSSAGPLFSRRAVSDGVLTAQGLLPRHFNAEQRILFSGRQWQMDLGPLRVHWPDGRSLPKPPGTQDEASQFVQLTWLFTTQPERLRVGQSVQMPLAIGRRVQPWTFDVVAEQTLALPFGQVVAFHVKPRGEPAPGDMAAEIWFAPTLQYLPVRILIRQASGHWVDLTLAEAPLQADPADPADPAGPAAPAGAPGDAGAAPPPGTMR